MPYTLHHQHNHMSVIFLLFALEKHGVKETQLQVLLYASTYSQAVSLPFSFSFDTELQCGQLLTIIARVGQ